MAASNSVRGQVWSEQGDTDSNPLFDSMAGGTRKTRVLFSSSWTVAWEETQFWLGWSPMLQDRRGSSGIIGTRCLRCPVPNESDWDMGLKKGRQKKSHSSMGWGICLAEGLTSLAAG